VLAACSLQLFLVVQSFFASGQGLNGNIVVAAYQIAGGHYNDRNGQITFQNGIPVETEGFVIELQLVANAVSFAIEPLMVFNMIGA
jgi:hypothetical protein